jgi:hypothetical protein
MASNNYAEVITDSTEAQRVKAELESMAAQGCSFLVREFNPKVDRFEVACWRESNYPTLLDVEAGGKPMDAAAATALWNANADTLQSINYGNGSFGLFYESKGRCYIAVPDSEQWLAHHRTEGRCSIAMSDHEEWLAHCRKSERK